MTPEMQQEFARFLDSARPLAEEACAAFEGTANTLASSLRGSGRDGRHPPAEAEADLQRRAAEIRTGLRRRLIGMLPAERGADRPTVEDLSAFAPMVPPRFPAFSVTLRVSRLVVLAVVGVALGVLLAQALLGPPDTTERIALHAILVALGAALATGVGASPIPLGWRRSLLLAGALSVGSLGLVALTGRWQALAGAIRGRLSRPQPWLGLVPAMVALFLVRLWVRRPVPDPWGVEAARLSCVESFREALDADVRLLAQRAAMRLQDGAAAKEEQASRETIGQLQAEVATALRQTRGDCRESLRRCAALLGVEADLPGEKPSPEPFRWTTSKEHRQTYDVLGIVREGDLVRVTRRPVFGRSEDGALVVLSKGEVVQENPNG